MNNSDGRSIEGGVRSRGDVLRAVLLYTGVLGSVTVGAAYLGTRSGGAVLVVGVVGFTVVTLVGGTGDAFSSSAAVHTEHLGGVAGDAEGGHGWNPGGSITGSRAEVALLYGFGLLVWSLLGLAVLWNLPT